MTALHLLPTWDAEQRLRVVVETPRGASCKIAWAPELGAFELSRPLALGLSYPYDWGFVPSTLAPDGDPLDAMVMHASATYPGVVISCRVLGIVELTQRNSHTGKRERNDRVIAVPADDERAPTSLDERTKRELQAFFLAVPRFTKKAARILRWSNAKVAHALIDQAATAHLLGSRHSS